MPVLTLTDAAVPPITLRDATPEDVPALAQALARAFHQDPAHRWLFPTETAWARYSHRRFAHHLQRTLRRGVVTTTTGLHGAALWLSPTAGPESGWARLAIILQALWLTGLRAPRVLRGFHALEQTQPAQPHWMLPVLGVDPAYQGHGIGAALLQPVLRRCDTERRVAYLVSSTAANIPFYERQGFCVSGQIILPQGPPMWPMVRSPG